MENKTNNYYRSKDINRYQSLPFVVGYEVRRSNNPNECSICEFMAGKYPKSFRFIGWCKCCKCNIISILATEEERDKTQEMILNGEDLSTFKSVNEVKDVPYKAITYIRNHYNEIKDKEWYLLNKEIIDKYLSLLSQATKQ